MVNLTVTGGTPTECTAVAMGLFDGLHSGHRTVISRAAEIAETHSDVSPAVFTFETSSVTSKGDGGVECILSREMKLELIENMGVRYIYSPDFSEFRNLSGEEFVKQVLTDRLNAKFAVCGEDFRFGKGAECGVKELDGLCGKYGIELCIVPKVTEENGKRISSTMIRELVRNGGIETANRLLGTPFTLKLPVSHGKKLGRTLDFPTLNQYLSETQVAPKYGVYASKTEVHGKIYKSITNIGVKPTVGSSAPLAETYIMDFDGGELYGETVKVSLAAFIRPEKKFSDIDRLKKQIAEDIKAALEVPESLYYDVPLK